MDNLEALFLNLSVHSISPLIVGFLMLILGAITLIREKDSKVSSSFFLVTFSIFVWLGSLPWLYSAPNELDALFWARISHFGVAFIPSFFFVFTLEIIQLYKKYKIFGWGSFILSGIFCAGFVFTPYLVESVTLMPWGYYPRYGPYGFFLIIYIALFMLISIDLIWIEYRKSSTKREKSRLKGIFLGVAIGLLGAVDFVGVFGLQVYPLGYIPIFVSTLILGQTIMRFRLIDITPSFAAGRILDTMEGLVVAVNLEGKISVVNRSLCELFGYDERKLKGQDISLIFGEEKRDYLELTDKSWVIHDEEREWRRREGTNVEISVSASVIADKTGELVGIVYTGTDITARKKAERELIEAKESAEQANKAKSDFLANMSHEIRTPLNAVLGFSDLLSDTPLTNIQKDYVDTVKESGKLLLALISDILDFSKIESGQIQLEEIDFNLKNLIEDVLRISRPKVTAKKIELYYHYDDTVPLHFIGDPTRVRQIILNLLNNAIKFTNLGDIGVCVSAADEQSEQNSKENGFSFVQISVKDTGVGIPKEKQQVIFETFTQADSSTTRRYGGTGLGLAITKALVGKMDGTIWVESEVDKGSEFTFTLKLRESDPSALAEISPVDMNDLKGKKACIIDDNENARRLIRTFCLKAGLEVISEASSAIEGLHELQRLEDAPDLILSDIMMPDMDGYELARRVRNKNFARVKLIAVSSDASPGSAKQARDSGFDAFMTKPLTERGFINILKTVLGDRRSEGQIVTTHMAEELVTKRIKVLVAEDNPVNKKLIGIVLSKLGCDGEIVSNGKEALERVLAKKYDVCLMDIHMPVMSGIEATEEIRKRGYTNLPIIALTADAFKEGKEQCLKAGMNDFLSRPVEPEKLKQKIMEWTA
jgi:two-component system sensor histidine kinase/response regulator